MISTEERFSQALHNAARAWRLAIDRRLRHLGLGQASWMTIANVAKRGAHPPSQAELAELVGVEAPTMVSMLDRLEKSGYVLRKPSSTDRRVKQVHLTGQGQAVYAEVKAEATSLRQSLLGGMERARLQELAELLETIGAAAESMR